MTTHFIEYIDIERYKGFENFSAKGFGRVNLIGGKNNVGKTAFMEALYINTSDGDVYNVMSAMYYTQLQRKARDYVFKTLNETESNNYIKNQANQCSIISKINKINFTKETVGINDSFIVTINDKKTIIPEADFNIKTIAAKRKIERNTGWVNSARAGQDMIILYFQFLQRKDREDDLNELVKNIDGSIKKIKVIGNTIQCGTTMPNGTLVYRDISEYGDGLGRYISVIIYLFATENSYIFIDEIENGIHYSALENLWDIILNLSKELNVQVFATTHSKECIEAYCRALERHQARDCTFITMVKNKENQIKTIVSDYDTFTYSIHQDHEVRGW